MADAHTKQHDYHLVDPSPWPALGALGALLLAVGAALGMHPEMLGTGVASLVKAVQWWIIAPGLLLIFAVEPTLLLRIAFGAKRTTAADSLFVLGAAFTVLACTYLAIQSMLALRRTWFLIAVAAVAIAEPILLLNASREAKGFAAVVLAIQAVGALLAFGLALRRDSAPPQLVVKPDPVKPDSVKAEPAIGSRSG